MKPFLFLTEHELPEKERVRRARVRGTIAALEYAIRDTWIQAHEEIMRRVGKGHYQAAEIVGERARWETKRIRGEIEGLVAQLPHYLELAEDGRLVRLRAPRVEKSQSAHMNLRRHFPH